jgi:hypothetical protein
MVFGGRDRSSPNHIIIIRNILDKIKSNDYFINKMMDPQ